MHGEQSQEKQKGQKDGFMIPLGLNGLTVAMSINKYLNINIISLCLDFSDDKKGMTGLLCVLASLCGKLAAIKFLISEQALATNANRDGQCRHHIKFWMITPSSNIKVFII